MQQPILYYLTDIEQIKNSEILESDWSVRVMTATSDCHSWVYKHELCRSCENTSNGRSDWVNPIKRLCNVQHGPCKHGGCQRCSVKCEGVSVHITMIVCGLSTVQCIHYLHPLKSTKLIITTETDRIVTF